MAGLDPSQKGDALTACEWHDNPISFRTNPIAGSAFLGLSSVTAAAMREGRPAPRMSTRRVASDEMRGTTGVAPRVQHHSTAIVPVDNAAENAPMREESSGVVEPRPRSRPGGGDDEARQARWCQGWLKWSNPISVVILVTILMVSTLYFVLQCTDIMSEMVDEPDVSPDQL